MFSQFNKKIKTIFLDENTSSFVIDGNVNVILSPEYYWIKKVSLPVNTLREVKPLIESLFEGTIPEGVYSYAASKKGDDFYIFAYEDGVILKALNAVNIKATQVKNVYFAQNEFSHSDGGIAMNETTSMYMENDLLIVVPSAWLSNSVVVDTDTITLSKNKIALKQFGNSIANKSLYTLGILFSVLIILTGIEYFVTTNNLNLKMQEREKLLQMNGLKPTMMQNRAMLSELNVLYTSQMKLRKHIGFFLGLKLEKEEKISSLIVKSKKLLIEISHLKKVREQRLRKVLHDKKINFTSSYKNKIWKLEIQL